MLRLMLWIPALLAVFPVLSLWRRNFDDVLPSDVVPPAVVTLVSGALVGLVWWGIWRERTRAVVASVTLLSLFYLFVPLRNAMTTWMSDAVASILVALLAVGLLVLVIHLLRGRPHVTGAARIVAWLAVFLIAWEAVGLSVALWQARSVEIQSTSVPLSPKPGESPAGRHPDIYHIVLDGYGRQDVLRELYDYDNGDFLQALRDLGFHVADSSRGNYVKTLHALSSVLNMAYVQELVPVPADWQRSRRLVGTIQSNRVVHMLRQRGYAIHSFASGYELAEFSNPDHHYVPEGVWSEFEAVFLQTTPLAPLLERQGDAHDRHRQRLRFILEHLPRIEAGPRPRYVFAHLLAPHPPFVVDRHGNAVSVDRPFGYYDGSDYLKHDGTVEGYRRGFSEQSRWVSDQVLRVVREILAQSGDAPPIILLHSDHGPGSKLDWSSLYDTDMWERFGILHAVHLPGFEDRPFEDDLSPVNLFRMVFDLYFGTDIGRLPARSYYTWQSEPFHYFDVTDPHDYREHKGAPRSGF